MSAKSIADSFLSRLGCYRGLILLLLSLLCLNVVVISLTGGYDFRIGFIHLTAHGAFKPILMMNGCFLVALMVCGAGRKLPDDEPDPVGVKRMSPALFRLLLLGTISLLVLFIYYPATGIDLHHYEWTQKHVSADKQTLADTWKFFTNGDPTGFYRPLGFFSLWMDYQLFGDYTAGYYAQSIILHFVNALLAAWLAWSLGFGKQCAFWTGALFAAAAVNFEAIIWPAARFDLLSTLFTLLALILMIRHLRDARAWTWALPASLLCYICGILNKESSYCFPLILAFILCTRTLWDIPRPARVKALVCLALAAAATAGMLYIRIVVYGHLGGYPTTDGVQSSHFRADIRTLLSLVRAMPMPVLGVNTSTAIREWGRFVPVLFVAPVMLIAFLCRGCFRTKQYALAAMLILSLAPVLNIVGWIGSWMQHSRYLYMPAVFMILLVASTAVRIRRSIGLLGGFLLINAAGAASNIHVYRDMLERADSTAKAVHSDWKHQPKVRTIVLLGLPEHTDGVFYFGSEVADRIGGKIKGAVIVRQEAYDPMNSDASTKLVYRWNKENRWLHPIAKP